MAIKQIIAVYQDCVLCGVLGRKKLAEYNRKGIIIRKVGFTTEEGKDLIREAVFEHKIRSMPFFVYKDQFSTNIDELLAKKPKKTTKKVKESNDGAISEG